EGAHGGSITEHHAGARVAYVSALREHGQYHVYDVVVGGSCRSRVHVARSILAYSIHDATSSMNGLAFVHAHVLLAEDHSLLDIHRMEVHAVTLRLGDVTVTGFGVGGTSG